MDTKKLAETLQKDGRVAFMVGTTRLIVIEEAQMEEGWWTDIIDPYELADGAYDGGLCTGSALDAVEFLL